jgi:AcrR family transcriptional regulator
MSAEIAGASVRRVPRQDRSEQRFELILDTTATLIDEVGYGNLTTSLIAKRVGMSGPGIYRYFDGLQAIAAALAARNLRRLLERATELIADASLEIDQTVDGLVGVYADMFRTEPGFRWLRLGDVIDRHVIGDTETNRTMVARHMADHFMKRYELYPRPDLLQHVEVMVEIANSLVARAFVSNPQGDGFYIAEAQRLLTRHLREYLASTLEEAERLHVRYMTPA